MTPGRPSSLMADRSFFGLSIGQDPVSRTLLSAVFICAAFFVVTIPAWLFDTRMLDGVNIWLKPEKFNISLGLHFLTIAILLTQIPVEKRNSPLLRRATFLALTSLVLEQVYVTVQVARGRRSHFNYETLAETLFYAMMGIGALLMVFLALALALEIYRGGRFKGTGYHLGAILGLTIGAITTIAYGGYMSASGSHWVGAHPLGGASIPIFGWSREVGDLRSAHFVTLHMMQALPIAGWVFDRLPLPSRALVIALAAGLLVLATALFVQALNAQPFWPV